MSFLDIPPILFRFPAKRRDTNVLIKTALKPLRGIFIPHDPEGLPAVRAKQEGFADGFPGFFKRLLSRVPVGVKKKFHNLQKKIPAYENTRYRILP